MLPGVHSLFPSAGDHKGKKSLKPIKKLGSELREVLNSGGFEVPESR